MTALLDQLTEDVRRELRAQTYVAEDIEWPSEIARSQGWLTANLEYHSFQRQWGRHEMRALLAALGLSPPIGPDLARDLVVAATQLYLLTDALRVVSRVKDGRLRLFSTDCPLYERFLDRRWGGLTACGCFSRRKGWYDALQSGIAEELIMSRKWGDPVCQVAVNLPQ